MQLERARVAAGCAEAEAEVAGRERERRGLRLTTLLLAELAAEELVPH